jgi:AcrR family transcriptional regulator
MADMTTGRRYGERTAAERHASRRARLVEAALDAFGTRGYAETSIGELCAEAGVSTRNFYEHFDSREALLVALHDEINAAALTAVAAAIATVDPDDLAARARAGVRAYLETMTGDRRKARITLVESVGVSRDAERHRQEAIGRFAGLIELEAARLADAGRLPRRDFRLTVIALVGAINGLVNTWAADPQWDAHVDDVATEAAELIVAGLARVPPRG